MSTHTPQVCGADSRQICWWHKMWEGENVTFFEGKETQVQELIFRSKIGRNQLAHGFTFLSKVPLEVCGQGCVTEEAPEEWSSFNSSHAFVPLCFCAFVPLCLCALVPLWPEHHQNFFSSLFFPDKRTYAMFFVRFIHIMFVSEENNQCKADPTFFLPFDPSGWTWWTQGVTRRQPLTWSTFPRSPATCSLRRLAGWIMMWRSW